MGLRKDVKELLALMKGQESVVKMLIKNNDRLMDKLMARNFPELKTFSEPDKPVSREQLSYMDFESLAGQVVDDGELEE